MTSEPHGAPRSSTARHGAQPGRIIALSTMPHLGSGMGAQPARGAIEHVDIYRLADLDLADVTGISISGMCDQEYLSRHQAKLEAFVRAGGRMLINGHVAKPFLPGLPKWRKLVFTQPADLVVEAAMPHALWRGVDLADVLYRTGVPGVHTRQELEKIGVAGFYGRGYAVRLPEGATVINTIGPLRAPIDYTFPLGMGEVVVHQGLDLAAFFGIPGSTLGNFETNIHAWLGGTV